MNEGMGEGVSYRARLLCTLKTELLDPGDTGPAMVEVENAVPVPDVSKKCYVNDIAVCHVLKVMDGLDRT